MHERAYVCASADENSVFFAVAVGLSIQQHTSRVAAGVRDLQGLALEPRVV